MTIKELLPVQYWKLQEQKDGKWVDVNYEEDYTSLRSHTHNCNHMYGVPGYLGKMDAVTDAIEITRTLDNFDGAKVRVLFVSKKIEVVKTEVDCFEATECIVSNEQTPQNN